ISFEKSSKPDDGLASQLASAGIRWRPLRYHSRPPVMSTAVDVLHGARVLDRELHHEEGAIVHARSYVPAQIALSSRRARRAPFLFDIRGFWADERIEGG